MWSRGRLQCCAAKSLRLSFRSRADGGSRFYSLYRHRPYMGLTTLWSASVAKAGRLINPGADPDRYPVLHLSNLSGTIRHRRHLHLVSHLLGFNDADAVGSCYIHRKTELSNALINQIGLSPYQNLGEWNQTTTKAPRPKPVRSGSIW